MRGPVTALSDALPEGDTRPLMLIGEKAYEPLVAETCPRRMNMPTGMVPQWPRVVTAVIVQVPSNRAEAALAGAVKAMTAKTEESARTRRRCPII